MEWSNKMYIVNGKKVKDSDAYYQYIKIQDDGFNKMYESITAEQDKSTLKLNRIQQLQDKAILEGLTDAEKEEYKKLKGGE